MDGFIISGILGSFIPMYEVYGGLLANFGSVGWFPLIQLLIGLLAGLTGYGLFNLIKSPSKLTKIAMILLSAIIGGLLSLIFKFFSF